MSEKTVFISYSHDSDAHRERVLALSERLRADGIETLLDRYVNGSPQQGWPRWMLDQLDAADSVLVICTKTYYRRFRGHEEPGKGKGVDWEGALITQEIYDARSRTLKFVPVLFASDDQRFIPEPLRAATHYTLASENAYQSLYDFLLEQAGVEAQPVGVPKRRERAKGVPLTFGEHPAGHGPRIDISRIDRYAPVELVGREEETKTLSDAWDKAFCGETKRPHVLTFVALGGEGKTSLVAKWAADLAHSGWPGCEAVFAWSFYHQGADEKTADSSDLFLKEALTFFGDPQTAGSAQGAFDKGRRLAQIIGEQRALLILDGVEPLQYGPTSPTRGEFKDQGVAALLKGLAASNRGLCVVTTRYSTADLKAYWQTTAPEIELNRLSMEAGVALLQDLGVRKESGSQAEFENLVEDVHGHALTLNLFGAYVHDAHAGDIRKRDLVKLEEADEEEQGGHAFRVMDAYVRSFESEGERGNGALTVLRLLGLFDRPATADCLAALQKAPTIGGLTEALVGMSELQRNVAFTRLAVAKMLTVNRDAAGMLVSLDAHPLLREYFARQLRAQNPDAWRAAHRRLYQHLFATTSDKPQPNLEDLQPLYQAVAHGCKAGLFEETLVQVYRARILRGEEYYTWHKLGAYGAELGAQACFFETPWSRVWGSLAEAEARLLTDASTTLRALGRLTEACEAIRVGLTKNEDGKRWADAADSACNLSELALTLGNVPEAEKKAQLAIDYADRSGSSIHKILTRMMRADALHQAGSQSEAKTLFDEAMILHEKESHGFHPLSPLSDFQYFDLLLAPYECAAWRVNFRSGPGPSKDAADHKAALQLVFQRATKIEKESIDSRLTRAVMGLVLNQVSLYELILESRTDFHGLRSALDSTVSRLREANDLTHVPRGLLTRAWLRSLTGSNAGPESAQSDLDEAWEIAERGPMPLFMADIHLYRVRLFGWPTDGDRITKYPWESPQADLAKARRLIEKHGYWRRKEELEDAEAADKAREVTAKPLVSGGAAVANLRVYVDKPVEGFNKAEFLRSLEDVLGSDASKITIVSIHRGSAVVELGGDSATLHELVERFQISQATFEALARATGMTKITWDRDGRSFTLIVSEETRSQFAYDDNPLSAPSLRSEPKVSTVSPNESVNPNSARSSPVDPVVVLVTVNDNETHALLDAFVGEGHAPEHVAKGGVTYNDLGTYGGCHIVHTVCEMGAGGIGASQQRTREAIEHWSARAIIAVGIAFGLDETKQSSGDVLVSTQIQDYELARMNESGMLTPRGDKPSSADILRNRFRQTDAKEMRLANGWPKVRFGLILSGQKLLDNLDYREALKALFTEAIGGEMEGVGLYVSASASKVDWIVVKGICDWGHKKNQAEKDAWQKLAAKNATRVLKTSLDLGGLYGGPSSAIPMNPQVASSASGPQHAALALWQEKLRFLQVEEAKAVTAPEKFQLLKEIETARAKISEYGGQA
jgi:nucleoside phosphorylase